MGLYKKTIKRLHRFLRGVLDFEKIDLGVLIVQKYLGREDPPYSEKTVQEMLAEARRKYPEGFYTIEPCLAELAMDKLLAEARETPYALEGLAWLQPAQ